MKRYIWAVVVCLSLVGCGQATPTPVSTLLPTPTVVGGGLKTAVLTPTVLTATTTSIQTATLDASTEAPALAPSATPRSTEQLFIPMIGSDPQATATPTPLPTPTPWPTVDFAAVRAEVATTGQQLAYVKVGFHAGLGTDMATLSLWMRQLDAAGVPFFLKSVDNAEPIFVAQELMKASGVPHILVYRRAGTEYDVPNYDMPASQAAQLHWQRHTAVFPPELEPDLVWLETINEVDKNRAEWLGQFALTTAELALDDGYRWAAFGWAAGEPEPEQWQTATMLAFLRLAGQFPDQLAIALHEYSLVIDDIGHEYPYKIGRFQDLLRLCDAQGIPRPTILITEWGWTYQEVPPPTEAMADIRWASQLYAHYPSVKGAAIWFLGDGFGEIKLDGEQVIRPLLDYSLRTYFTTTVEYPAIVPQQFTP